MRSNVCCLETFWLWYRAASGMGWLPVSGSHQPGTIRCPARRPTGLTNSSLLRGRRLLGQRAAACTSTRRRAPRAPGAGVHLRLRPTPHRGACTPQAAVLYCVSRTSFLITGARMLKAKKIRLDVSEQDAATLEMMQGKCRGLYNWWVMKLRAGERWNWKRAKKTLAESRKYDPPSIRSMASSWQRSTSGWTRPCKPSSSGWRMGRSRAFPACARAISSSPCVIRPPICCLKASG